jgi:DNA-binding HxlR family transcriptional regulator
VSSNHDVVARLLPVVSQRYAVDILDAQAERPCTYADLRTSLRARRRGLDRAIRILAAQDAIRRPAHTGSWDRRAPSRTQYDLTATGQHLADQLAQLDTCTAIYEYQLYGPTLGNDPHD